MNNDSSLKNQSVTKLISVSGAFMQILYGMSFLSIYLWNWFSLICILALIGTFRWKEAKLLINGKSQFRNMVKTMFIVGVSLSIVAHFVKDFSVLISMVIFLIGALLDIILVHDFNNNLITESEKYGCIKPDIC